MNYDLYIKKHEKLIKKIVNKYYKHYKDKFAENSVDMQDLMQVGRIAVWETLKKYQKEIPNLDELEEIKLLVKGLMWGIKHFIRVEVLRYKDKWEDGEIIKEKVKDKDGNIKERNVKVSKGGELIINTDYVIHLLDEQVLQEYDADKKVEDFCETLDFNNLKNILTKKEYDILYGVYVQKKTVRQLGEEMDISKSYVDKIHQNILNKLKTKLTKNGGQN